MGALMKYWQDPEMLAKLGDKLGDIAPAAGAAAAANASAAPDAANEVSDLLSACRCAFLYFFFSMFVQPPGTRCAHICSLCIPCIALLAGGFHVRAQSNR